MKKTLFFGVFSAALAIVPAFAEVDCLKLSLSVKDSVAAEQAKVLEIVSQEVAAAPACACEIVKAAIEASTAKPEMVAAIVESASTAAPEQMRLISQCAVAVAPDSLAQVQAVMAKLDPNSGESAPSSKGGVTDSKDSKGGHDTAPESANPLDFPGQGPVGPTPGGPGGIPLIPVYPPVIINPPVVTVVDPS